MPASEYSDASPDDYAGESRRAFVVRQVALQMLLMGLLFFVVWFVLDANTRILAYLAAIDGLLVMALCFEYGRKWDEAQLARFAATPDRSQGV